MAERGRYDEQTVYAMLDGALYSHAGFVFDSHPFVLPTIHGRRGIVSPVAIIQAKPGNRANGTRGSAAGTIR